MRTRILCQAPPPLKEPFVYCSKLLLTSPHPVNNLLASPLTEATPVPPFAPLPNRNLRTLILGNTGVTDLTGIDHVTSLEILVLSNTRIEDVTPLAGLGRLQELVLSNSPVVSVDPIGHLHHLYTLDLRCTRVEDVTPLAECNGLSILGVLLLYANSKTKIGVFNASLQVYSFFLQQIF